MQGGVFDRLQQQQQGQQQQGRGGWGSGFRSTDAGTQGAPAHAPQSANSAPFPLQLPAYNIMHQQNGLSWRRWWRRQQGWRGNKQPVQRPG